MVFEFFCFFFFSSRRRHTRYIGDWSSDVCSSDLTVDQGRLARSVRPDQAEALAGRDLQADLAQRGEEIGRASCRERVEIWVVAGSVKKKREKGKESGRTVTKRMHQSE